MGSVASLRWRRLPIGDVDRAVTMRKATGAVRATVGTWTRRGAPRGVAAVLVVMASYLSNGLLAPQLTSSHIVHAAEFSFQKLTLKCLKAGARCIFMLK